jgi:hypothetical protein
MSDLHSKALQVRLMFSFDGNHAACRSAVEDALRIPFRETRSAATGQVYLTAAAVGLEMHLGLPDSEHSGSFSALTLNALRAQDSDFEDISWHFIAIFSQIEGMRGVAALA